MNQRTSQVRQEPPAKVSTSSLVTLFAISGLVLGICSLGLVDVVFHTTKPFSFLEDWHLFLFISLFAVSLSLIPIAARSQHGSLVWFLMGWVGVMLVSGYVLSVTTSIVHHRTLSIPNWLIPGGLLAMPIVASVTIVLIPRFWKLSRPAVLSGVQYRRSFRLLNREQK